MSTPNNGINGTLGTGLLGHWNLDGDLLDMSGNGHDMALTYGVELFVDDEYLDLDDVTSDRYETSTLSFGSTQNLSLSTWIKTTSSNTHNVLSNGNHGFFLVAGKVQFVLDLFGLVYFDSISSVNDGQWHHIAMTFDGVLGEFKGYIDGILDNENLTASGTTYNYGNIFGIAAQTYTYKGSEDEMRAYSRTLTPSEVLEIKTMGRNYSGTLTLNESYIQLRKTGIFQLIANQTATWTSSNENIAIVDSTGFIIAISEGTAIITATAGALVAYCIIKVGGFNMQSMGLYDITVKNSLGVTTFLGETPQDGAFVFSMAETTQQFFTKGGGQFPTEARTITGPATLTVDLIYTDALANLLATGIYLSGTINTYGLKQGCPKETFEVVCHPKCFNITDTSEDIKFLKAYVDITSEFTATIDGKKLLKCVFTAMNTEVTLPTAATPTKTSGGGTATSTFVKIVATNGTGVALPSTELELTTVTDHLLFTLPVGATGIIVWAGTATGPAGTVKYYHATDAQILAGEITDCGAAYIAGTGWTAGTIPSAATGYYYKAIEIGD